MNRLSLVVSILSSALATSCGSSDSPATGDAKDTGGDATGDARTDSPSLTDAPKEGGAADPTADPVPADLPALLARSATDDVPADLSCAGKPLPIGTTPKADHAFDVFDLGADATTDRIAGAKIEIFHSNTFSGTPDVTATSGTDGASKGLFNAQTTGEFVAIHAPAMTGYLETIQLDIETRSAVALINAAPIDRIDALSKTVGGAAFKATPGTTRLVMRAVDCQYRPLVNAHVVLEIGGVVTAIAKSGTEGVLRSYFGDTELPSFNKWTSCAPRSTRPRHLP